VRSDADSSKVAYLLHRLFHWETFGNVCLNSYGKDVSEAACYLSPWDYLEARICLGSLSPDESSHHAIVVCYYDPLKALLNGSLYHFSRRVECVESAASPVAIDSVAVRLPFHYKTFQPDLKFAPTGGSSIIVSILLATVSGNLRKQMRCQPDWDCVDWEDLLRLARVFDPNTTSAITPIAPAATIMTRVLVKDNPV